MQFSEQWLRAMVDPSISSEELAHLLTMAGLEVEETEAIAFSMATGEVLDDTRFTLKLTPNRADCLSLIGVAREVSVLSGAALRLPASLPAAVTSQARVPVSISGQSLCGRFTSRVIENLNASAPIPLWMQQRLESSGIRPVSALVDISNYVMLEMGQPSHIFDLNALRGELEVRWGRSGESLTLLNDVVVEVDASVGVIADSTQICAIAGVMGGRTTSVSAATKDVLVEVAWWRPDAIRGQTRRYKLASEAAHRFERGVDFAASVKHLERITELILDICGIASTTVGPVDDNLISLPERKPIVIRTQRTSRVIGVAFTDDELAEIFSRLQFEFSRSAGEFRVVAPSHRFDLEIEEDLIEEVARVYGFENIPIRPPIAPITMSCAPENWRSLFDVRHQVANLGYQETVTMSFLDASAEVDFADNIRPVRLVNPIASHMSVMRSTLIGSLVAAVLHNLNRKERRVRLFEIGTVFLAMADSGEGQLTDANIEQPKRLAAVAYGSALPEQWGVQSRPVDYFDVKADLENLFSPMVLSFERAVHAAMHPERSAVVKLEGRQIGIMGELHPSLVGKYALPLAPVFFEVAVEALQSRAVPTYVASSRFPVVIRDLALIVPLTTTAQTILDAIQQGVQARNIDSLVQTVAIFDEYRGQGVAPDERCIAIRFTLQDSEATLVDDRIGFIMGVIAEAANLVSGVRLRK